MAKAKTTGKKAAKAASKTLRTEHTGGDSKAAAGSALSQTKAPEKTTSKKAAGSAADVLNDGRTNATSKTSAGSALSQKTKKAKKR